MNGAHRTTHEVMRGPNTFGPLLASMRRAVTAGFQTRAIFTVTTANIDDALPAVDLADDVGLDMISFHYFTPTGLGAAHPEYQLPPSGGCGCADSCERPPEPTGRKSSTRQLSSTPPTLRSWPVSATAAASPATSNASRSSPTGGSTSAPRSSTPTCTTANGATAVSSPAYATASAN